MTNREKHDVSVLARYAKANAYKDWIQGDPLRVEQNLMSIREQLYLHPYWPRLPTGEKVPLPFVLAELYEACTTGKLTRPFSNIASHREALTKLLSGTHRANIMEKFYAKNPDRRPVVKRAANTQAKMDGPSAQRAIAAIMTITGNQPEALAGRNEPLYQYYLELLETLKQHQNELQQSDGGT